jgi:hypothetical protein
VTGRRTFSARAIIIVVLGVLCASPRIPTVRDTLPERLTDHAFWHLVQDLSEEGGYFRSDNLISNEDTFQQVVPTLRERLPSGGVYLGVGPDQNFTYIVAVQPKMAFIVDVRRQNLLLHLMHKALMELSPDRAEWLARLFSRARPPHIGAASTARALFEAYEAAAPSPELFQSNFRAIVDRLVRVHGFTLSADDIGAIEYVYRAFYTAGPDLRYSFPRQFGGGRWFPSYAELMMETDAEGEQHSYLATERNYQILRSYQMNNLVVPVVGDFGGDKALRSIGAYLKVRGGVVSLFYTSNVEQYLFQSSAWRRFFDNVGALPVDGGSTMLRSFFNTGFRYSPRMRMNQAGRSTMLTDSIVELVRAVRGGRVQSYSDVIERSR